MHHEAITTIDGYLNSVPLAAARAEEHGPLVLFVPGDGTPWPYYARPRARGLEVSAADVAAVRARQRDLRLPQAFEWIDEACPSLRRAAADALSVEDHPLMVLAGDAAGAAVPSLEIDLPRDRSSLRLAQAVAAVGFAAPGTARGSAGARAVAERALLLPERTIDFQQRRVEAGLTVVALARLDGAVVAVGSHQPRGDVTEIVGVATLPAFRRRGIGAAVTACLAEDARRRGVRTIFLSAGDGAVARVYERVGFRRIGTACEAAPAPP